MVTGKYLFQDFTVSLEAAVYKFKVTWARSNHHRD